MNKQDSLERIRQSIISQMIPLVDDESLEPRDRFSILSRLAQSQGEPEYFNKSLAVVPLLNRSEQLTAYAGLLESVEAELLDAMTFDEDGVVEGEAQISSSVSPSAVLEQAHGN